MITRPYPPNNNDSGPWIVTCSDLRRYTYRAIACVARSPKRVLFIPTKRRPSHQLKDYVLLGSVKPSIATIHGAIRLFQDGHGRRIRLASLPRLTR